MTIEEFIEQLQQFDKNLKIKISDFDYETESFNYARPKLDYQEGNDTVFIVF